MNAQHTQGPDWYERRHELEPGMVFQTTDGVVQLHHSVPGDGTKWCVLDWNNGWGYFGSTIEPGDLQGEPLDTSAYSK